MVMSDSSIFIVDDDQMQNEIHSIIIKKLYPNISVITFRLVEEAVKELQSYNIPEILFLDLHIPGNRITDLLEIQKSMELDFDVYLISSLSYLDEFSLLEQYPAIKGYITKPLQEHKLRMIINHLV
jgi:response regulator of citrate/malate metabolism